MDPVAKPDELLALFDVTAELFDTLKGWFAIPDEVPLDLSDVDAAVDKLADPVAIAALAMRKLQALRLLSQPGVRTSTDVVVTIVQDLDRALVQAPTMRLRRAAQTTDWDAELADLLADPAAPSASVPPAADDEDDGLADADDTAAPDPETARFRDLHARLHLAARAVVEASDGQIRHFE